MVVILIEIGNLFVEELGWKENDEFVLEYIEFDVGGGGMV